MKNSIFSNMSRSADSAANHQQLETLNPEEIDQVGGGLLGLIIFCVACALLLAHD